MTMHREAIHRSVASGLSTEKIAKKIYLSFPTFAFIGEEDLEFDIKSSISDEFNIPLCHIHIVGSAKIGWSTFKSRPFDKTHSDLDVAIVNPELFLKNAEFVLSLTRGFADLSGFGRDAAGKSNYNFYRKSICNGIFRPDLMPACPQKADWGRRFNNISNLYRSNFAKISGFVYMSEFCLAYKQISVIDQLLQEAI